MPRPWKLLFSLLTLGFAGCTGLPFAPQPTIHATPAALGLPYENVRLTTPDGETIAGWYIPAPVGAAGEAGVPGANGAAGAADRGNASLPGRGSTLLFFHGNAGNISHRLDSIAIFHQLGMSQLIIDYRGFGESTGKPSVDGTVIDASTAWAWLTEHKHIAPERIIIFGRSLGGGVAAALAAKVQPRALILESTFTSIQAVAEGMYPWLPVSWFIPQDYDTPANLKELRVPLLVVHSPDDATVSYRFGRELYEGYAGPKQFLQLHGSHNSGFLDDRANYMEGLRVFLGSLPALEDK